MIGRVSKWVALTVLVTICCIAFAIACGNYRYIDLRAFFEKMNTGAVQPPPVSENGIAMAPESVALHELTETYLKHAFNAQPDEQITFKTSAMDDDHPKLLTPGSSLSFRVPQEANERRLRSVSLYLYRLHAARPGLPLIPMLEGPKCECTSDMTDWQTVTLTEEAIERRNCSCTYMKNCKNYLVCSHSQDQDTRKQGDKCVARMYDGFDHNANILVGRLGVQESGSAGEGVASVAGALLGAMSQGCQDTRLSTAGMSQSPHEELPWGSDRLDLTVKSLRKRKVYSLKTAATYNYDEEYPLTSLVYRDGEWKTLMDVVKSWPRVDPQQEGGWDTWDVTEYITSMRSAGAEYVAFHLEEEGAPVIGYAGTRNHETSHPRLVFEFEPLQ